MAVCIGVSLLVVVVLAGIGFVFFTGKYTYQFDEPHLRLFINTSFLQHEIDERFLSVALDTSFMGCPFHKLTEKEWERLEELTNLLSPAYLRLGGTKADKLLFLPDGNVTSADFNNCIDGKQTDDYLILTGDDWIKINEFANKTGLNLIMDLNVLLRDDNRWNSTNARTLIEFSEKHGFPMDFQLGNEPNSFPHVFNVSISGSELGMDFDELRKILDNTDIYRFSKVIGPDVTRPKQVQQSSMKFLDNFLTHTEGVDVVSWHQYYLNGRTANLQDFIDPKIFDEFPAQIESVKNVVKQSKTFLPIWLSETSSAYGGGAPKLSDRYAASFLWLDKLGVAAKSGISAVIRQSLFKDHYALINPRLNPSSDFWISFFYKNLVGNKVLNVEVKNAEGTYVRFYAHCVSPRSPVKGSLVIFGMNLTNKTELFVTLGLRLKYPIYSFTFRPEKLHDLTSRGVLLNDIPLIYNRETVYDLLKNPATVKLPLIVPYYSINFWIFSELPNSITGKSICAQNTEL